MYQAGVESILGFQLRGKMLILEPCIPRAWHRFELDFRYHSARYEIVVENPQGVSRGVVSAELDGRTLEGEGAAVPLADDGLTHGVRVVLG
jgi:cyclic beta-1,2-glucan synthetase